MKRSTPNDFSIFSKKCYRDKITLTRCISLSTISRICRRDTITPRAPKVDITYLYDIYNNNS